MVIINLVENSIENKILQVLANYPNGLRKEQCRKEAELNKTPFYRAVKYLENEGKITQEKKGEKDNDPVVLKIKAIQSYAENEERTLQYTIDKFDKEYPTLNRNQKAVLITELFDVLTLDMYGKLIDSLMLKNPFPFEMFNIKYQKQIEKIIELSKDIWNNTREKYLIDSTKLKLGYRYNRIKVGEDVKIIHKKLPTVEEIMMDETRIMPSFAHLRLESINDLMKEHQIQERVKTKDRLNKINFPYSLSTKKLCEHISKGDKKYEKILTKYAKLQQELYVLEGELDQIRAPISDEEMEEKSLKLEDEHMAILEFENRLENNTKSTSKK
jgi:hypothetical protein